LVISSSALFSGPNSTGGRICGGATGITLIIRLAGFELVNPKILASAASIFSKIPLILNAEY